jgi:hypothetical protein
MSKMMSDEPSLVIEMNHRFDGNVDALVDAIRMGRAFSLNGKALPIEGVRRSGPLVFVPFPHRTIEIDLSSSIEQASKSGNVNLSMRFEK